MRGRRLRWTLAGLAVVLATGLLVSWCGPIMALPSGFRRIEKGMTPAEVDSILGPGKFGPYTVGLLDSDDFDTDRTESEFWGDYAYAYRVEGGFPFSPSHVSEVVWLIDGGSLVVAFEKDRAVCKRWVPRTTAWQRLRRQLRSWFF